MRNYVCYTIRKYTIQSVFKKNAHCPNRHAFVGPKFILIFPIQKMLLT